MKLIDTVATAIGSAIFVLGCLFLAVVCAPIWIPVYCVHKFCERVGI